MMPSAFERTSGTGALAALSRATSCAEKKMPLVVSGVSGVGKRTWPNGEGRGVLGWSPISAMPVEPWIAAMMSVCSEQPGGKAAPSGVLPAFGLTPISSQADEPAGRLVPSMPKPALPAVGVSFVKAVGSWFVAVAQGAPTVARTWVSKRLQ
jgi:hypothetical protein